MHASLTHMPGCSYMLFYKIFALGPNRTLAVSLVYVKSCSSHSSAFWLIFLPLIAEKDSDDKEEDRRTTESQGQHNLKVEPGIYPHISSRRGKRMWSITTVTRVIFFLCHPILHPWYFPSCQWTIMQMQTVKRWCQYNFLHITVMKTNRGKLKSPQRVQILDSFFFCWRDCEDRGYCRPPWIFSNGAGERGSTRGRT